MQMLQVWKWLELIGWLTHIALFSWYEKMQAEIPDSFYYLIGIFMVSILVRTRVERSERKRAAKYWH
ncbi:hypothetical protein [Ectobacillus ponti]|uniref:Uncharacterized protein n=1 Tax=Ectobacillus ponti TaxID=2961894 RepID=A0AA42BU97_9BACI|nr:hypothetical protein [Ectobacillus ponti]MCP8970318.1 hypothetical protein [Ectobacillus ponti]